MIIQKHYIEKQILLIRILINSASKIQIRHLVKFIKCSIQIYNTLRKMVWLD